MASSTCHVVGGTKRVRVERIVRAQSSNSCHLFPSPGAPPCKNGFPPLRPSSGPNFLANFWDARSEEHTSELQSLMRISYPVFCMKKKNQINLQNITTHQSYTTLTT